MLPMPFVEPHCELVSELKMRVSEIRDADRGWTVRIWSGPRTRGAVRSIPTYFTLPYTCTCWCFNAGWMCL